MGTLPTLKPREVVARLESLGFAEVRQRGSHKQFRHADGRGTTVPFHAGRAISPTLLRKIAKDIGLTARNWSRAIRAPDTGPVRCVYSFRSHRVLVLVQESTKTVATFTVVSSMPAHRAADVRPFGGATPRLRCGRDPV